MFENTLSAESGVMNKRGIGVVLTVVGIVSSTYLFLWMSGVTPASSNEREFISMLGKSQFSTRKQVRTVLASIDKSVYIARSDFFAAEEAFLATQNDSKMP